MNNYILYCSETEYGQILDQMDMTTKEAEERNKQRRSQNLPGRWIINNPDSEIE